MGIALYSLYRTASDLILLNPLSNTAKEETNAQKGQIDCPRLPSQHVNARLAWLTSFVSYTKSFTT